jgi:zinc transport system substrate-binding protein
MQRWLIVLLCLTALLIGACSRQEAGDPAATQRIKVVTTLFPLYDFARNIGGDRADVSLLLPPGVEPHSFDPKPDDLVRISRADLFVYTNPVLEPWAVRVGATIDLKRVRVINASAGIRLRKGTGDHEHGDGHDHAGESDPHLWLDFANAALMVNNLAEGMATVDPGNRDFYLANAAAYRQRLVALDEKYRTTLAGCSSKVLLQGGHFAFGYLAERYGLDYRAAAAVNPDAEPTPARIADLVRQMRTHRLRYVFSEELVSPRLAETIARESGAGILPLNAAHSVSREEFAGGVTFLALMERNLANLATGLECR